MQNITLPHGTKSSGNLYVTKGHKEIKMKKVRKYWSDLEDAKKTNEGLKDEILSKFPWCQKYTIDKTSHLRTIGFRKMTPDQMSECAGSPNFCERTLFFLDKNGHELFVVGKKSERRSKQRNCVSRFLNIPLAPYFEEFDENVIEALSRLGNQSSSVMYVVERYTNKVFSRHEYHWLSLYIYKTPKEKEFENFAEFVKYSVTDAKQDAKQELTKELEKIDS